MESHELARKLLEQPSLPVATHSLGHTYMSKSDAITHGPLKIGILESSDGNRHIIIGDITKMNINGSNWHVSKMIHGIVKE